MVLMRRDLPRGTVTFLFTDVESSTRLLHELGAEAYAEALAEHRRIMRGAFGRHGGVEVDTQGDAFFVAFASASGAVHAAAEALEGLAYGPIRVRMGIHTGKAHMTEEGYVGADVHRAARVAAAGHGGQVLVSAATRALLGTDGLSDLGEHRLKDFDEPVSLYQLGSERFPPLKTISNTNLPRPASSFVGRQREVEEVLAMLRNGARLLTLTGPGGSGKTRLALEAAAELVPEFKAGVFWVGLAPLRDRALVTETIAGTLGAKDDLADHIAERELLLLLDNFEQVIEAAADLASLVEHCPNLHLLVTSRELLRVPGERAYPVPPLVPEDGTELFLARALATQPGFVPGPGVAELCATLDNLPLALELAAARVRVLSVEQLLERLSRRLDVLKAGRGVDARQQTLRATIEWSHDLLDEDEQRLFARLAVFRGGCTLTAAEQVAEADLDVLQSLVDKSLLRRTDGRFRMLETIREYSLERLEKAGEAGELRRRHAEYFVGLGEEAEPHLLSGEESGEWLDRLEREHDNIRAALDHLQASGETQLALQLAGAVWEFWQDRGGHFAEGRRRLERLLRADERPTAARAKALSGAAAMAWLGGDAATGRRRAEEALALHRLFGDDRGTAEAELWLGWAFAIDGDWATALQHFEQSLRLARAAGDREVTAKATHVVAWAYAELGDRERARRLDEENLPLVRELRIAQLEATTLDTLAGYAIGDGRVGDAVSLATESLRIYRAVDDPSGIALELARCACAFALTGRPETAARLLAAAEALQEELGVTMPWVPRTKDETFASIRAQLDEAALAEAWEQGRVLTAEEAAALAIDSLG
jgi:predicted ATPase/class 3 adenylate cyclase